jgi:hypothetical protein
MKTKSIGLEKIGLLIIAICLICASCGDKIDQVDTHTPTASLPSPSSAGRTATMMAKLIKTNAEINAQDPPDTINISETPTFEESVVNKEGVDLEDSLDNPHEKNLYLASLKFIAANPDEANEIARSINYINNCYETASNMCGPLSIAILQEGGLLSSTLDPHDAWLLCFREREGCDGLNVLQRDFFPPQTYDYFFIDETVRTYDLIRNPLQPGDFLYLLAGDTGYDHLLVVTHIDQEGAAYSVTNSDRGDGFKILEELLYHPNKPHEGFFYEFTERSRRMLGMTGNGGMVIIRRKGGLSASPLFTKPLDNTLIQGVNWHVFVKEISTSSILFESYPNKKFQPTSMIKVPLAMVAMELLEDQGIYPLDYKFEGYGGRTFEQLFEAMVVNSEEDATEILHDFINSYGGEKRILAAWGIMETTFLPRRTTCFDLADLLEGLYDKRLIHPDMSDYLLNLMSIETANDAHYLGSINTVLDNSVLFNKRGTLLSPTIVSDMGIFVIDGQAFIIIVSGTPTKDGSANYEDIQASIEDFALQLGRQINDFAEQN